MTFYDAQNVHFHRYGYFPFVTISVSQQDTMQIRYKKSVMVVESSFLKSKAYYHSLFKI